MFPVKNIKYLNLPPVPKEITDDIKTNYWYQKDLDEAIRIGINKTSLRSGFYIEKLNKWGRENICQDMMFTCQLLTRGSNPDNSIATGIIHKDTSTTIKLLYIVEAGGDNVYTSFYSDQEGTDLLFKTIIEPGRWTIFEASQWHHTQNIEPGKLRVGIAGQVFRDDSQDVREDYSHLPPHSIYNNN